ncbi:MAG TPA: sugar-binding protein, partial [Armatimonadota bacterium]|nr:sugar-binding protein [Armatimonadota bacterium]
MVKLKTLLVLLLVPVSAGAEFLPPVVTVGKVTGADAVWSQPAQIQGFLNFKGASKPTQQTEVRLAYDDSNLYAAFRCYQDDNPIAAYSEHDGPVWRDDSIEGFLDPLCDGKTYFHFIANAACVKFESKGVGPKPESWDGEWQVAIAKEDKAWTA